MSELSEYIITLKSKDYLDDFYNDMETLGGDLYIPDRAVTVVNRRPNSRNTHYMLSESEVDLLRADSRVLSVELTPAALGLVVKSTYEQTSDFWTKSSTNDSRHKNWGLLRVVEGVQ